MVGFSHRSGLKAFAEAAAVPQIRLDVIRRLFPQRPRSVQRVFARSPEATRMLIAVTKFAIFPSASDAADVYDDQVSLTPVRVRVCRNDLNLCYLHTYFWVEWSDPISIIILKYR